MELQQLRTTGDTVLIHIPERLENTLMVGGKELWFDSSWHPLENKHLGGILVAVPETVGGSYLLARERTIVPVSAIQERLCVGDYVYADYTVSEDHGKLRLADFELPGVGGVYRATLNQLVARVREGADGARVLEPFGSYVLCEPVWPDDVEAVDVPGVGTLRLRVSASGLTLGSEDVPPIPFQGVVRHVGLPLRGQPARCRVGDRVVFDKQMCGKDARPLRMKLEGVEYLCIRQDYIAAVLVEEVEVVAEPEPFAVVVEGKEVWFEPARVKQAFAFQQEQKRKMHGHTLGAALGIGEGAISPPQFHEGAVPEGEGWATGEMRPALGMPADSVKAMMNHEWFVIPPVPKGYNFDIAKIEAAFKAVGEDPSLTKFLKHFQASEPCMVGGVDLIKTVREQGGITPNLVTTWGKYDSAGNFTTTTVPPDEKPILGGGLGSHPLNTIPYSRGLSDEECDNLVQHFFPSAPAGDWKKPVLVTTCCGAGYYQIGEPNDPGPERCKTCKQVAHLVSHADFYRFTPPAA